MQPLIDTAMQLIKSPKEARMAIAVLSSFAIKQFQNLVTKWQSKGLLTAALTAHQDITPIEDCIAKRVGLLEQHRHSLAF